MNPKQKMLVSFVSLLVALALLAGSSLAWFTLSTKPETKGLTLKLSTGRTLLLSTDTEVEDDKDRKYYYTLNLSEAFKDLASLHPVSTADGIHWYIPTYNTTTGAVNPPDQFILDTLEADKTESKYGNVSLKGLEGRARQEKDDTGYYVYTDFLIKTQDKNGCDVYLSIPKVIDEKELDGFYGSYVLPCYELDKDGKAASIGKNAETAIRIGFLITEYDDDDEAQTRFVIYEPNADSRSVVDKKPTDDNTYISGYNLGDNTDNYKDGWYIPTEPIGYEEVKDYDEIKYYKESEAPEQEDEDEEPYPYVMEQEYVAAPYAENSPYRFYTYDGTKYELYTGDYTEDNPPEILYRKNYVLEERYIVGSNIHYSQLVYTRYTGDYEEEEIKPILYSKTSSGEKEEDATYSLAEYIPGATYYTAQYVPLNFSYYDTYAEDKATYLENPVDLYTKDGTGYHAADPEELGYPGEDGAPTYYFESIHFTEDTIENGTVMKNLYGFGYTETVKGDDPDENIVRVKKEIKKNFAKTTTPEQVIVQMSGSYDTDKIEKELKDAKSENRDAVYNSTMVKTFGKFVETPDKATDLTDSEIKTEYASDTLILTLKYEVPVKIRLCIWIEGQDVDCWNDITSGTFNINLELAGYNEKN